MPDGKAVDAGQSASHVGCISNSQATRSDDESRSVGEGRAHHDDDEERPRRLAVEPAMLGYTKASAAASLAAADKKEKIERSASAALEVEVDGKRNCSPLCCL